MRSRAISISFTTCCVPLLKVKISSAGTVSAFQLPAMSSNAFLGGNSGSGWSWMAEAVPSFMRSRGELVSISARPKRIAVEAS